MKKQLTILSGAGISVASGLKTFRGHDGLWEGYDIQKVASIDGWHADPELVLEFYNKRRAQVHNVEPNEAHFSCAALEDHFDVHVITQNVDNLHERGGSSRVMHLHGELMKGRSSKVDDFYIDWTGDMAIGDRAADGSQIRPAIVWFGEEVPLLQNAAERVFVSEIIVVIGTSMQVYPAASLVSYAPKFAEIYYIDPNPSINYELGKFPNLKVIAKNAIEGMEELQTILNVK